MMHPPIEVSVWIIHSDVRVVRLLRYRNVNMSSFSGEGLETMLVN